MIMILIMVILSVTFMYCINIVSRYRSNYPPGPFSWPFVGNQFYFQKLTKKLGGQHYAFWELSKKYNSGIIGLRLGVNDIIVISDSHLIQSALLDPNFDGRPWNEFINLRNMGMKKGITMNDGPVWKELRTWSVRTLRIIGFNRQEMIELLTDELSLILKKLNNGGIRRIKSMIEPVVLNVLWTLITGKRTSSDSAIASKFQNFIHILDRRTAMFDMSGGILSAFPWLRYIAPESSGYNILIKLNIELKSFLMDIINDHKQQYVEGSKENFISMFLQEMFTQQDENSVFTDDNLLLLLIDFFIAGASNTSSMLDIIFLQMVNHQDVQRKLHEEIDIVIGSNRFPNIEDRVKMPFAEAILTECQRMHNIVPIIGPRRVFHDTSLGGYTIPKNTNILFNIFCNNMNPEFYPDPTSFKPERFVKDNVYQSDKNIILFGKGRRRCPGDVLAKNAMFLIFVNVMQKYRLLPVQGKEPIKIEKVAGLSLVLKPYEMLIIPR